MHSRLTAILLCFCLVLSSVLVGCTSERPLHSESTHIVTFYVNGAVHTQRTVEHGDIVPPPLPPQLPNLLFDAWTSAPNGGYDYDFSVPVTSDLNLYASYVPDAISITNEITTNRIRAVVQVENTSYNDQKFLGLVFGRKDVTGGTGSGVIIGIEGNTAYMRTNCHVAAVKDGREHVELTVVDYRGNRYAASYYRAQSYASAVDPTYDLALLTFRFDSSEPLLALELAEGDPAREQHVIAVGHPKGQSNAIAYGRAVDYRPISLQDTTPTQSDVKFNVLRHNAFIDNGSSGGPLLNTDLQIAGINYASTDSETFTYAYAIPSSRVREFLQQYGYLKE
jgi:serine protease Do